MRAYPLQRPAGNPVIYSSGRAAGEAGGISVLASAGSTSTIVTMASPACDWVGKTFGAPL